MSRWPGIDDPETLAYLQEQDRLAKRIEELQRLAAAGDEFSKEELERIRDDLRAGRTRMQLAAEPEAGEG